MSGLNLGIIKETKLRRPPIEMQNHFANVHMRVESIKTRYQQSLAELENLYGTLSQKAFKDELDLSRVPLIEEDHEKEKDVKAEKMSAEETKTIELPAPADLSSLTKAVGRKAVIENWLDSYLKQLDGEEFDTGQFMQLTQLKLDELIEDEPPELGVAEYDWIKKRVFQLLEQGQLIQAYDDNGNRVLINRQGNNQS